MIERDLFQNKCSPVAFELYFRNVTISYIHELASPLSVHSAHVEISNEFVPLNIRLDT